MFTLSSRVRNYNTRPSFAGNFNQKNVKNRRGLKFGTVSPRIWENSKSMLSKNKYINLLLLDLQRQDSYADIDTLISEIKKESSQSNVFYVFTYLDIYSLVSLLF